MIRPMTPAHYLDRHEAELTAFLQQLIRLRTDITTD